MLLSSILSGQGNGFILQVVSLEMWAPGPQKVPSRIIQFFIRPLDHCVCVHVCVCVCSSKRLIAIEQESKRERLMSRTW